jgi:hypothetical protein
MISRTRLKNSKKKQTPCSFYINSPLEQNANNLGNRNRNGKSKSKTITIKTTKAIAKITEETK